MRSSSVAALAVNFDLGVQTGSPLLFSWLRSSRNHCSRVPVMAFFRHGHAQTPEVRRPRRGWRACHRCAYEASRKSRDKKVAAGRWWEFHTTRPFTAAELKMFAGRLAHGETISQITTGTKKTHKTALYHRWMVWKNLHPDIGKRLRRLALDNKAEQARDRNQARREFRGAPWVATPPPAEMWAIIDAVVPRGMFSELRMEVCQRLALEIMERRCECTAAGLRATLAQHKQNYFDEYADRWGDVSLDQDLFGDGRRILQERLKSD